MFPDHVSGVGLVLLRALTAATLISTAWSEWMSRQDSRMLAVSVAMFALASGLLLLLGYLTSLACFAGLLISLETALSPFPVSTLHLAAAQLANAYTAVIAVAIFCLGPGAYSLDALRRGRREIVIPARQRIPSESDQ
jgi:uncharacterized membrane protein YphA (DoxX/SURF4 family)